MSTSYANTDLKGEPRTHTVWEKGGKYWVSEKDISLWDEVPQGN